MGWVALGVGCVSPYRPPTEAEPHAVVKFRRSYEEIRGEQLREVIDLGDYRAYSSTTPTGANVQARTDVVLVHPNAVTASIGATFFHREMRMVQERYTERVSYMDRETYDCSTGFGTSRQYRQCSRMVTKYRDEPRYRTVTKPVEVSDGTCTATTRFDPKNGKVYLIQFSYQGHGACAASCFEQVFVDRKDGKFDTRPCAMMASAN